MKILKTPRGLKVNVPELDSEDISPKFNLTDIVEAQKYYDENGYVIFKNLLSKEIMEKIKKLWDSEVKPFKGYMYRQATARAEKHVFDKHGWIMNPILNLQSVDPLQFPSFRETAVNKILSADSLKEVFKFLLQDTPKIVQSMYFEGNSATWEHQDSYYLDSENIGKMSAAWIAVENISAEAGRFFICPKSHKIDLGKQDMSTNIADNHEVYIQKVVEIIKSENLEIRAPILNTGDTLFWNSWTIHGSLDSTDNQNSRSSITCHAIPKSDRFLQLQSRILELPTKTINKVEIYAPKDLSHFKNKNILWIESHFPQQFYWIKNKAVKFVLSRNS